MTCNRRATASLLFCSLQQLSFNACFIVLQAGWRLPPQEQLKELLFSHSSLEDVFPARLLGLKQAQVLQLCLGGL